MTFNIPGMSNTKALAAGDFLVCTHWEPPKKKAKLGEH